jgi:hypothetical protein
LRELQIAVSAPVIHGMMRGLHLGRCGGKHGQPLRGVAVCRAWNTLETSAQIPLFNWQMWTPRRSLERNQTSTCELLCHATLPFVFGPVISVRGKPNSFV